MNYIEAEDDLLFSQSIKTDRFRLDELYAIWKKSFNEKEHKAAKFIDLVVWISLSIAHLHRYAWVGDRKGYFVRYYNGKYYKDMYQEISRVAMKYMNREFIANDKIRYVLAAVSANNKIQQEDMNKDTDILNYKNGYVIEYFDEITGKYSGRSELIPHDNKWNGSINKTTFQIPYDLDPDATCPIAMKFVKDFCLGSEDPVLTERKVWEWIGYATQMSNRMQKALLIEGAGDTAKSTLLAIIDACLSPEDTNGISLKAFQTDRHAEWYIYDKVLNLFSEREEEDVFTGVGKLKRLIGDPMITFIAKFGKGVKVKNITKHIWGFNTKPIVEGADNSFYDKFDEIKACHVIEFKDQVPAFENIIIKNNEEMKGIIYQAYLALDRLFKRGHFEDCSREKIEHSWRYNSDLVFRFIEDKCIINSDLTINTFYTYQKTLFSAFSNFLDEIGTKRKKYLSMTSRTFTAEMGKNKIYVKQVRERIWENKEYPQYNRPRAYINIMLKPEPDDSPLGDVTTNFIETEVKD